MYAHCYLLWFKFSLQNKYLNVKKSTGEYHHHVTSAQKRDRRSSERREERWQVGHEVTWCQKRTTSTVWENSLFPDGAMLLHQAPSSTCVCLRYKLFTRARFQQRARQSKYACFSGEKSLDWLWFKKTFPIQGLWGLYLPFISKCCYFRLSLLFNLINWC